MPPLNIQTLPPCTGRTLVIGDVHGCAQELATLLEAFSPQPQDRLIAVGDLINRGPDSAGVLALARRHRILPVLGNHELRLLMAWQSANRDFLKGKDKPTFNALTEQDWSWIAGWPHAISIPSLELVVVHGGFLPGIPWREQDPALVTSIQVLDGDGRPEKRARVPDGRPWASLWQGPPHVVYGHTPRPEPLLHPHATGIDTGCVYGYDLTAVSFPDFAFYRVQALRPYVDD